ncbi:DUF3526 domain-containing protein [Pedobacter xixiisoli]|uniref:ABC-2 type transport system permease protein n=1 Tax=Pedobacter xixiisoli TaxID=1476464 RepID=A0A285ZW30_9SPHI|nr:DUF3526 domain-containing protein [Pedobacter xixiisoli]SOD13836.1 ABC-2 type transport system permease protein [Pedobacter xixiisoli]
MNNYLYKQFFRNRGNLAALLLLWLAGTVGIYTGKRFLERNEDIIAKSASYQQQSIAKNVALHQDNMGLLLYYLKFNFVNETPKLAALNIGMRDLNPSIQGVTIRNLEEQKHNSDFYNPANAAAGNFDFSFVLVFLFPLVIIAFCYNLISEDQEKGTWKLLSVQSGNLRRLIDAKILLRLLAISVVYLILLLTAVIWIGIPLDTHLLIYTSIGWLYLVFWFVLCRWIISFQGSSAQNALVLVVCWVAMNFIIPMSANLIFQKIYPVKEGLEAQMAQREGYHNKWDEAKAPTMQQFYKAYPQFSQYKVGENVGSSYVWYYAMQHAGDMEAAGAAKAYDQQLKHRNDAAILLGYILPNVQTQLMGGREAGTGMENYLAYGEALQQFHEAQRLFFYPLIFSEQRAGLVDWSRQTVKVFSDSRKSDPLQLFLPYLFFITLLFVLSNQKFKKLC